jgi:hypothetical protein
MARLDIYTKGLNLIQATLLKMKIYVEVKCIHYNQAIKQIHLYVK